MSKISNIDTSREFKKSIISLSLTPETYLLWFSKYYENLF